MMYPRLKLARNLLCDAGLILISLDDTEIANMRQQCNEIFGEENLVACLVWLDFRVTAHPYQRRSGSRNSSLIFK